MQSFKLFLDELLSGRDDHADRFKILKDYLDSIAPSDGEDEENRVYLRDVMQIWDYARRPKTGFYTDIRRYCGRLASV